MLIELLAQYYKYLWLAFGIVAFLKFVLSYMLFQGEGMSFIFSLFKWFSEDEREIEDEPSRRSMMKTLNLVTLIIYILLLVIVAATLLLFILKR